MESITKEDIENWVYDKIELVELFIIGYVKTCAGIIFFPKRTLGRLLTEDEMVSPIFFFLINVFIVIVDGKTISDVLKAAVKNVLLTTKPTWDNTFFGFLSYIAGLTVF